MTILCLIATFYASIITKHKTAVFYQLVNVTFRNKIQQYSTMPARAYRSKLIALGQATSQEATELYTNCVHNSAALHAEAVKQIMIAPTNYTLGVPLLNMVTIKPVTELMAIRAVRQHAQLSIDSTVYATIQDLEIGIKNDLQSLLESTVPECGIGFVSPLIIRAGQRLLIKKPLAELCALLNELEK